MRIVCVSDTHNKCKGLAIPDGDVLIHAGDGSETGDFRGIAAFLAWVDRQPHPWKIVIAGNHDWLFQREPDIINTLLRETYTGITYLQDSGCEINGIRFWGSPWQPWFRDWAFNLPRRGSALKEKWNAIPPNTDVLVTHGPPFGILDQIEGVGIHLGCEELAVRLETVRPQVHVFGHIHSGYGVMKVGETLYLNASILDEQYKIAHRPFIIDMDRDRITLVDRKK
jgi:Icc-related predicted phosphoesterase